MAGVAQYHWNCSVPNSDGERYIPGIERDFESDILTTSTARDTVNLYRVQNTGCYINQEIIAIEFCYQYNTIEGDLEPVFNWTVLILEEANLFTITRIITIESHPNYLNGDYCDEDIGKGRTACCDREYISSFNVQTNIFVFGVVQGNTHNATLLGFHESQNKYLVDTVIISAGGQNISVGSTLPRPSVEQRGLRLFWFVIGMLHTYICVYQFTTLP